MSMHRREFLQVLAVAAAAGMPLASREAFAADAADSGRIYELPRFGNVHLLHFTDCHAQLLPIYFREPSVNLGIGDAHGRPPHLVGEHLLKHFGIAKGTREAHAFTFLDFDQAARSYGKVGGFAHLSTLVKRMKASRPGALLLDGGDTWQGSATSLWTNAQDMVDACKLLGVDVMTAHWEMTYGAKRVQEIVDKDLKGKIDFVAQNVKTTDFGDQVFAPYTLKEVNGVKVAIIGQAFPYTPIANPRYLVPDWSFGIQDENMQKMVDEARGKGAQVVVVPAQRHGRRLKWRRARGVDAILGGTRTTAFRNRAASVCRRHDVGDHAGSNGSLGVLDFDVKGGKVRTSATSCCRCSRICCRPIRRWTPTSGAYVHTTRRSSAKSSQSPKDCCTGVAISTGPLTS
jgi:sulfur-oxidizing protein SoxB